ncbi:DUF2637 domain-containing protein [Streptomyces sp. A3M-1-3]|uniref:DUF2637 domain-containing protein n=1 Tax=Streptomyces sp. A3M-1-3 TaxID=2962044 RepID=UPI0020B8063D|nr:DUF2637 domain-containing protein [Streptomyces sp. A3M-1-3]MCP3822764.1 DUF2637 domain-containing protein [Streptomyces sp. A3M-1-3]
MMQMQEGRGMVKGTSRSTFTRTHRILIRVVAAGAVVIAGIGFAGSYAAVRELAEQKGFGAFSVVFPIGIDAGICVLLALDLLLTWMRIPFPLLRQTAWLLTAATIAFNGAAAWPDPLGVGMHAVIPMLFVVSVEAARHAVGRIADITADKHMEGVRLTRWLLAPIPTFLLWRRMKLWELRSYEQVIKLEQDRLIYQARLQSRFGRAWRRKAPVESLMPLRLAKYGVPLAQTGPAGLAAAGIEAPVVSVERDNIPADEQSAPESARELVAAEDPGETVAYREQSAPQASMADMPVEEVPTGGEVVEPMDYYAAVREYLARYGAFPYPAQFGVFLAQEYGVTDPVIGGPLDEAQLGPVLAKLEPEMAELAGETVTDVSATADLTDDRSPAAMADPVVPSAPDAHPFIGASSLELGTESEPEPLPYAAEPVPATASMADAPSTADDRMTGGRVPRQESVGAAPSAATVTVTANAIDEPVVWEASVTDSGEATARVPEQQLGEPELDPVQQQIVTVAGWLAEAEDAGKKLSGAEVARRLNLSPKTGQVTDPGRVGHRS